MSRIFLLSDQPVLLRGFEHILTASGFDIGGSCPAAAFAMAVGESGVPDVLLLDITAGLTFSDLNELHSHVPDCPVVLWADALPLDLMFRTLEFGVRGIVQRNVQPEQLVEALRKVMSGELQIGFGVRAGEMAPQRHNVSLTPREREIVSLLRQGLRNKQIAGEMGITEGTVKIYLFRLFHKLGVRNRFELARCGSMDNLQISPQMTPTVRKPKEAERAEALGLM
ncbi:MAG: response regulator transcription factor [Acidobacteriota bacterium]|nr:response regulator transcription factor [Acidobacteriota bacterium]